MITQAVLHQVTVPFMLMFVKKKTYVSKNKVAYSYLKAMNQGLDDRH